MMEYLGTRRLVATYFLGGLAGALIYVAAFNLIPLFGSQVNQAVAMGASASAMAIMVATATLLPDYQLGILFIGPVRLKWIALVVILLDLINVNGSNAGGHIAHLGGAAFGYVFIRLLRNGTDLSAIVGKGNPTAPQPSVLKGISGSIGLSGRVTGVVYTAFSPALGQMVAEKIFGGSAGEQDVNDVVAELTNMFTGNLKSMLCDRG